MCVFNYDTSEMHICSGAPIKCKFDTRGKGGTSPIMCKWYLGLSEFRPIRDPNVTIRFVTVLSRNRIQQ
jgi:hypothetical protein